MKTDTYTKTILTIIAICLTINVLSNLDIISTAKAEPAPMPTTSNVVDVNVKFVGGKEISTKYYGEVPMIPIVIRDLENSIKYMQSIPVEVKNKTSIPVEVKNTRYNSVPVYQQ